MIRSRELQPDRLSCAPSEPEQPIPAPCRVRGLGDCGLVQNDLLKPFPRPACEEHRSDPMPYRFLNRHIRRIAPPIDLRIDGAAESPVVRAILRLIAAQQLSR